LENYISFFKKLTVEKNSAAFRQLSLSDLFDMEGFVKWHESRNKNSEFIRQLVAT
jgi:hypothetical protein